MTLDNGTDGQTDRQTDRVRRNMRPPPREEGRILIIIIIIIIIIRQTSISGDTRETSHLYQRVSVLVQRFNAVLLHDSLPVPDCTD